MRDYIEGFNASFRSTYTATVTALLTPINHYHSGPALWGKKTGSSQPFSDRLQSPSLKIMRILSHPWRFVSLPVYKNITSYACTWLWTCLIESLFTRHPKYWCIKKRKRKKKNTYPLHFPNCATPLLPLKYSNYNIKSNKYMSVSGIYDGFIDRHGCFNIELCRQLLLSCTCSCVLTPERCKKKWTLSLACFLV